MFPKKEAFVKLATAKSYIYSLASILHRADRVVSSFFFNVYEKNETT